MSKAPSVKNFSVLDLKRAKKDQRKLSMVTCYDACMAKALSETEIDMLLVGDSVAMVMHGHADTLAADVTMMTTHTAAVRRGAANKFIVADMPFLSTRKGLNFAVEAAGELMRAGANAVKIEGVQGQKEIIAHIVESGIPVMGHLGLTPQSVHQLGGYKVQGKGDLDSERIMSEARGLEDAGAFSLVLECVPSTLAHEITSHLEISTIGIGAGVHVDGQVLVLQDMLGMSGGFQPKFLRRYAGGLEMIQTAVNRYHKDVVETNFPNVDESYN